MLDTSAVCAARFTSSTRDSARVAGSIARRAQLIRLVARVRCGRGWSAPSSGCAPPTPASNPCRTRPPCPGTAECDEILGQLGTSLREAKPGDRTQLAST